MKQTKHTETPTNLSLYRFCFLLSPSNISHLLLTVTNSFSLWCEWVCSCGKILFLVIIIHMQKMEVQGFTCRNIKSNNKFKVSYI